MTVCFITKEDIDLYSDNYVKIAVGVNKYMKGVNRFDDVFKPLPIIIHETDYLDEDLEDDLGDITDEDIGQFLINHLIDKRMDNSEIDIPDLEDKLRQTKYFSDEKFKEFKSEIEEYIKEFGISGNRKNEYANRYQCIYLTYKTYKKLLEVYDELESEGNVKLYKKNNFKGIINYGGVSQPDIHYDTLPTDIIFELLNTIEYQKLFGVLEYLGIPIHPTHI